jgi:uncharacterized membrane protein YedE/YeeE
MIEFLENLNHGMVVVLSGLVIGLGFGFFAQQSRFCLRAATVEFWRGVPGEKVAIWLLTFSAALLFTQLQIYSGSLDADLVRQLNGTGSLSGAVIGGAMFGFGMILARGCASRLLVLSATGNLRALTTGLVLTVVAQSSLTGALSPLREEISGLWLISGGSRNLANPLPEGAGLFLGAGLLALTLNSAFQVRLRPWITFSALCTGLVIATGWWLTSWHASWSYELVALQSVSLTGPSTDTLMAFITSPDAPITFSSGLVAGIFLGSLSAALWRGEFRVEVFSMDSGTLRYLVGAVLMGFGAMLAGGCAVGAGISGSSVLATTSLVALFSMWLSAGAADYLFNQPARAPVTAAGTA